MPEGTFCIFALQSIYIASREKGHINMEQRALIFILLLPKSSDIPLGKGICVTLLFQLYLHSSKENAKHLKNSHPLLMSQTDWIKTSTYTTWCTVLRLMGASIFIKTTLSSRKYSAPESCKSYHQQKLLELFGHSLRLHYWNQICELGNFFLFTC